ncbi:sarcosine oxidase subunit gamma [Jannaschia sp. LMIT008]|uniref:sarcosine oxidase subunit gamma n=1 Tax=Jannaschia maritima TaxID=3032585 RepID=UPI0028126B7F|nr:sarcosine oxidase subunit gamma [Jannaschia sp. LMIT008]
MPDARVERVTGMGMLTLRGAMDVLGPALGEVCALAAPDQRMSEAQGGLRANWMSPDEIMVVCPVERTADLAHRLEERLTGAFATVVDVSDARAAFDVTGLDAAGVLTKLMPVDFARMQPAEVRRTRMAQIPATCWCEGRGWRVVCFRSVAAYADALLRNAAASAVAGT